MRFKVGNNSECVLKMTASVSVECVKVLIGLMGVAAVRASGLGGGGATSSASVSKPEGRFDYNIDHSYYGSVYGSAYPHGYGGLGDDTGSYKTGDAHFIGALPHSLPLWPSSSSYDGEQDEFHGGYAASYANYNQKPEEWSQGYGEGHDSYGYGGYEEVSHGWH